MSMSVRAGRAFVEMVAKDEGVRQSLDELEARLKSFGQVARQTGSGPMMALQVQSVGSLGAVAAAFPALYAGFRILDATVAVTANTMRVLFSFVTAGMLKAAVGIGTLAALVARFAKGTKFAGFLQSFLSKSQITESLGRWSYFIGSLTGSPMLKTLGNKIQNLGLGSSIVAGFQQGLLPGLTATAGAAFRSVSTVAKRGILNAFTLPFRAASAGIVSLAGSITGIGPSLATLASPAAVAAQGLTEVGGSVGAIAKTTASIGELKAMVSSTALKVLGFAGAISGPALLAGKGFATASAEIVAEARKTGRSIKDLIEAKYGERSFISTADIQAGYVLSKTMTMLKQTMSAIWAQIGAAALPVLQKMTNNMLWASRVVLEFLANNRPLVAQIIKVSVSVAGMAGAVLTGIKLFGMLTPVILGVVSPLGLVAGGVVALLYLFPRLRDSGMQALSFLSTRFKELSTIAGETINGIGDAISSGNLRLAAEILWAGLKVAWLVGTQELRAIWSVAVDSLSSKLLDGMAAMQKGWVVTTTFFGIAWDAVLDRMKSAWTATQNWFAQGFARVIAKMTGQNANDVLAELNAMQQADAKKTEQASTASRITEAAKRIKAIEDENKANQESLKDQIAGRDEAARNEIANAQEQLNALRAKAKQERGLKEETDTAERAKSGLTDTVGSFSAASVGQMRASGLGNPLLKPTEEIARTNGLIEQNTRKMGVQFAP